MWTSAVQRNRTTYCYLFNQICLFVLIEALTCFIKKHTLDFDLDIIYRDENRNNFIYIKLFTYLYN